MGGEKERDERVFHIAIDVSNVKSNEDLHSLLKSSLNFPDFYGMNMSAFWDAITGLVEMPINLTFIGWNSSPLVQYLSYSYTPILSQVCRITCCTASYSL
ncbi:barstar family protein [Brevibacillus formosus]|uniref:barstar family protein n=1 Tax=Brevibacillus formosus TaxID=54913 RepID=UPI000A0048B5|nr:barstar family protein [Brevibacillus formosus]MED1955148.1 barstar family protein [Brevibacillus formosus]PSJ94971.1 hypothetical protein C7R91_16950 [Brevibacillus formosus]